MKIKAIAIMLALLTTGACLYSCSNEKEKKTSTVTPAEYSGDNELLSALSDKSFDGYEFRMLLRKGHAGSQYQESDSDDLINSAIYRRNKLVEERFGITISASESSSDNYDTDALNSILAGDDAYDMVLNHSRAAMAYALQGAAININDIDSINLDKPYWTQDLRNTFEIGGKMYFLDGDFSVQSLSSAMCICFNKRIFDDLGFEYPYELVKNGEWTFDEFAYLAKKGGKDLNGDGLMKPEDDMFGFYDSDWYGPIEIIYTGGQKICGKNDEGLLELTLYSNKTADIFSSYFDLMENKNCFLNISDLSSSYTGQMFTEGRAMMTHAGLGSAVSYRGMDDDFGIVPWPKYAEEDEYASIVNAFSSLGIIPVTVSDPERTGAIAEALCAYGSVEVVPAFYDVTLKTKSARDNDSEEMMDIIKDSIVYDIGYVSGGVFSSTGYTLARASSHDFASFYASNEKTALAFVDEFNEDYVKGSNNE